MADLTRAFTVDENGIVIENDALDIETAIINGSADPTISGFDLPIGSLYLRINGAVYIKTAAGANSWTVTPSQRNTLAFAARHG